MKKITKEQREEIDKLFDKLIDPSSEIEISEETKKIFEVNRIVKEAIEQGNYKLHEVIEFVRNKKLNPIKYIHAIKSAYIICSGDSSTSDEVYEKMDDVRTVRAFKLNEL